VPDERVLADHLAEVVVEELAAGRIEDDAVHVAALTTPRPAGSIATAAARIPGSAAPASAPAR
jgi:hypothetical protein